LGKFPRKSKKILISEPYHGKFQEEREMAVINFRKFLIPRKKGWSEGSPVPISPRGLDCSCIHGDPGAVGCKQTPPPPSFLPSEEPTREVIFA